jgi:hypothetical protein
LKNFNFFVIIIIEKRKEVIIMTKQDILEELKYCELSKMCECTYRDFLTDELYDSCEVHTGASKAVFIPNDEPVVIKVPYTIFSSGIDCYEYEEEYEPTELEKDYGTMFYCSDRNYCKIEENIYKAAVDAECAAIFAKTEIIIDSVNYEAPIYQQEKCCTFFDNKCFNYNGQPQKKDEKSAIELSNNHRDICVAGISLRWLTQAITAYGYDYVEKAFALLEEKGINDFHENNYGYSCVDNRPVFIDYSGYTTEDMELGLGTWI